MRIVSSKLLRLIALTSLTSVVACNNPVDDDDDHLEDIVGVEVTNLTGAGIAAYANGAWTFEVGDALQLQVDEEKAVRIFFVAEDGDRFQLPPAGAEFTYNVAFADPAIVAFDGLGSHGLLLGLAPGQTTATFVVFHGDHPDWETSVGMPIVVE